MPEEREWRLPLPPKNLSNLPVEAVPLPLKSKRAVVSGSVGKGDLLLTTLGKTLKTNKHNKCRATRYNGLEE